MTIEPIKEKLDEKIAKLNSSRVYKKITPRGDLSWYIKWASSILLIIAMVLTSANVHPELISCNCRYDRLVSCWFIMA